MVRRGSGYYSTVYSDVYVGSGRKYYGSGSGGQFADFGPSGSGYYEYTSYVYAYGEGSFIDESVAYTYGSGDQNYVFDVGSFIVGSGEYYGSFGNPSNTSSFSSNQYYGSGSYAGSGENGSGYYEFVTPFNSMDARFVDGELYTAEYFSGGADLNVEFDGTSGGG